MRIKDRILQKKKYLTTRNSISSVDSLDLVRMNVPPSARKRWTTLESAGRSLFVLSTILLLVGISITILGFIDLKMAPSRQLFLQIIGPACLMATAVMWVVGGVFCRLWTVEMQRQKHSMELRTRVQLHALAIDLLKNPQIFSTQALEDPQIRSQLLLKLRQQNALDTSSLDSISRKSSRVPSIDTRSRLSHSSLIGTYIHEAEEKSVKVGIDCKKSLEASISTGSIILPVPCDLPGIHISRIETLDFDDMSMLSGFGQLGSRRYIIIESDGLSDCSKMSVPNSECSFSMCSRSSRSRSSKDSSNFGSRIWDFSSPRESEWEVNVPNNLRLDASNGYTNLRHSSISSNTNQNPSFLSPMMPRKGSTVTFGKNETTGRRHSSPASSFRKKEGRNVSHAPNLTHENNFSTANNSGITPKKQSRDASNNGSKIESSNWLFASQQPFYGTSAYRKKSAGDQSLMSIIIDENDGDEDEENKNAGEMDESNNNHALSGPIKFSREPLNPYIKSLATIHQQNLSANIADKENICQEKKPSMIQECYDDSDENVSNKCISFLKSKLEVNEETRKNADRGMHDNEKKEIELRRSTASSTKCKETDVKDKSMNHSGTEKTMTRQKLPTFASNFKPKFRETNLKNSNLSERDLHSEKKHADNFNYELLKKESTEKSKLKTFFSSFVK